MQNGEGNFRYSMCIKFATNYMVGIRLHIHNLPAMDASVGDVRPLRTQGTLKYYIEGFQSSTELRVWNVRYLCGSGTVFCSSMVCTVHAESIREPLVVFALKLEVVLQIARL